MNQDQPYETEAPAVLICGLSPDGGAVQAVLDFEQFPSYNGVQ